MAVCNPEDRYPRRRKEDLEVEDCVDTLLPSIDGSELVWRRRVRAAMKMFLIRRYLPHQAMSEETEARVSALEAHAAETDRLIKEYRERTLEKIEAVNSRLTSIESGIGLLKWLVPGVPVAVSALIWLLTFMKVNNILS